ncbi:Kinesin-like protein KIF23 [Eumeta japonica]|uniref:Kinesin-like protein n=1 Tax=Eumeta variegata TaxID=151549 RepID=A0A4C1Z3S4_EUMVA|nr:Kinesin-like protein KIF23 [Eumeta japonica]
MGNLDGPEKLRRSLTLRISTIYARNTDSRLNRNDRRGFRPLPAKAQFHDLRSAPLRWSEMICRFVVHSSEMRSVDSMVMSSLQLKLKSKTKLNEMRTPSRTKLNGGVYDRDPVQVYCRVRPMHSDTDVSCMKIISATTVLMTPSATAISHRNENIKSMKYTFKEVFKPETSQQEVFDKVASPLVEGLLKGKNGLLFTYGVTGSGKTFTMTGEPQNCGILPRCLNVIFKTINDYQAHKYVFKPDKMNMFDIQTEAEAMLERQQELHKFKAGKKNNSNPDLAMSSVEVTKIDGINEDHQYAVFVTYVEIYNNCVFDLLEDGPPVTRNFATKMIREDGAHKMYVHGVTEIEIKSAEEAFEAFYLGLKRKRMAHTTLNAESSRSHSVFTIRLAQAPVDEIGEAVLQNKEYLTISQLSLVDLAGSERTNRTNNTGQRLREASNINKSLMTLRTCLEALRENQINGTKNMVPYRESKITHLFKNFFEGEGHVRMVVCVNPRAEDYDENLQVMRFAEMASEVEVARPTPIESAAGLTVGRRKANRLFNTARDNINRAEAKDLELDLGLVYSLGPDFPSLELNSSQAAHIIKELTAHLEMRINRRETLKRSKALKALLDLEKESLEVRAENAGLRGQLATAERRARVLEERLATLENSSLMQQRKLNELTEYSLALKRELQEKELLLSQNRLDKEKQKKILTKKYNNKIAAEHEKAREVLSQREKLRNDIEDKENRLRMIAEVLGKAENKAIGACDTAAQSTTREAAAGPSGSTREFTPGSTPRALPAHLLTPFTSGPNNRDTPVTTSRRGIAVANPRHRRSLSADGRGWVEHAPPHLVPMGTVLKPSMHNSKFVNKLTSVKDIANPKTSKYCLISQEQDTDGELETKLYKGDVVPTCGGGAQVIFNDVEMLKQMSPNRVSGGPGARTSSGGEATCARHSAKRRDTAGSPPRTPSNTSKKQRTDED